ncbi:flavodoxin domain protein [Necator americanus]|uniref:Flavodoxin domain protein n=1 Tax=Necator americanus TaxID=51031 RepID=W2TK52_NECAM|nr:flavodoxin domain protein [Necator americanus]ETN82004.1 flavodoxin domain protein [Necator americanus]
MHNALIVVVLAATLMECSVALPDCGIEMPSVVPPLENSTRERLSDAVHEKMKGDLVYNCYLEYLGWLALNDPSDSELGWLPYEDTHLLNFSKMGDEENKPTEEFVTELGKDTKVTGKSWKLFGCNYMYKEGEHKYMCVFYNY